MARGRARRGRLWAGSRADPEPPARPPSSDNVQPRAQPAAPPGTAVGDVEGRRRIPLTSTPSRGRHHDVSVTAREYRLFETSSQRTDHARWEGIVAGWLLPFSPATLGRQKRGPVPIDLHPDLERLPAAASHAPPARRPPDPGRRRGMSPAPIWEAILLRRPPGSGRARVMGRVRFRAPAAARAREFAEAALAERSGVEPGWSLGLLRALTPNAPGTHPYTVTFARWEASGERFIQRDVHEREVWAPDAASARRLAAQHVQSLPDYVPAWRVRQVVWRDARQPRAPGAEAHPAAAASRRE